MTPEIRRVIELCVLFNRQLNTLNSPESSSSFDHLVFFIRIEERASYPRPRVLVRLTPRALKSSRQ